MRERRVLNVSDLAPGAFGYRSILWWGTAAMMAIVDGVLIRPLPYNAPERLYLATTVLTSATAGAPAAAREPALPPSLRETHSWTQARTIRHTPKMTDIAAARPYSLYWKACW